MAVATFVVTAGTVVMPGTTAWAAPQGTCTTGSYAETTVGSDTVGTFSSPSNTASSTGCTWTVPAGVTGVRVLVVAGGGGGGGFHTAGGGGAGGVLHEVGFAVTPGATLNVTVGKGGAPGSAVGSQYTNPGGNGADSFFDSLTAVGGGGGGGGGANSQIGNPGSAGGSGGGGGRCWVTCNTSSTANANKHAGGAGTAGQGNAGGHAWFMSGAGGGGAGAPGADDIYGFAGNGGDGVSIDITGTGSYYGGGGGGGTENTATRATGGLGGGGLGGSTSDSVGADGTAGTGGGGGGARYTGSNGGSGIVIVRWGSAPVAPSISLSNSSGYTLVNTAVTSLYSITNTGGAVTSYSISPSLPSGLTFSTVTGLISGTPTGVSSATNYTITGRRLSASNGASSSSTATFNYGVYTVAPTTTTTSTTTTTTTAVAPATTVATTTTVAPGTTVASGGGGGTGTTVPSSVPVLRNSTSDTVALTTTTSTVPVTTTTVAPGPQAPDAAPGEGSASIDGESVDVELSRAENALTVSAAGVKATVYGIDSTGARVALNQDGNLALQEGETVVVEGSGYEEGSLVEVWLHSTPVQLGTVTVDSTGATKGTFVIPSGVGTGDHRVLVSGATPEGKSAVLAVGLRIGSWGKESNVSRWIILSTIAVAITLGLVIPTTTRRRRKTVNV